MLVKKPKIAILTIRNSYNYGGVLSSLKVAYTFCSEYFQPTVFFLGFGPDVATSLRRFKFRSSAQPFSYFGMNCIEVGARWAFWEPGHYWFTYSRWKELLADFDYVFVVSGTCIAAHPLVLLDKKFVMWIGTPYDEDRAERVKNLQGIRKFINRLAHKYMNNIEKKILQHSSFTWAISTYARNKFEEKLGGPRMNLISCGYPIETNGPPESGAERDDIIVAVGRFNDPRKNFEMLMRVFNTFYAHHPEFKLYVIGSRPDAEKVFPFMEQESFQNIVFTGQIGSSDLTALLGRSRLMLITSYQEGLGIVGLEAMRYGVPVIATNCGGPADYVINDQTGYLVDINDDDSMVARMRHVVEHQEIEHRLSFHARQLVFRQFSRETIYGLFKQGLHATYPELEKVFSKPSESVPHESSGRRSYIYRVFQPQKVDSFKRPLS